MDTANPVMEDILQDRFWENRWKSIRLIFPILKHRLTRHDMCNLAFSGSSMRLAVSSDCPQGGVLSPPPQCLVVDSITRLNGVDTYTRVRLTTFVF